MSARVVVYIRMTTTTITGMQAVAIPVTSQDLAKELFEALGFRTRLDAELRPGFRWVELALDDNPTALALVQTGPELPTGIDTGIRLTTADARAARDRVTGLGLDAGELLDWDDVPLMFSFSDRDQNRFYVSQA